MVKTPSTEAQPMLSWQIELLKPILLDYKYVHDLRFDRLRTGIPGSEGKKTMEDERCAVT